MNFRLLWVGLSLILMASSGCQNERVLRNPQTISVDRQATKIYLQNEIQRVLEYLQAAKRSRAKGDTTAADYYYSLALDRIDTLSNKFARDSSFIALKNHTLASYDSFLIKLRISDLDSLSVDQEIEELTRSGDQDSRSINDTVMVRIPDVIDQSHEMRIPLVLNRKVEKVIRYFTRTSRGRRIFSRWLKRSGRYENLIKRILREEGVPEELFYLAMIESGFSPYARSYARAVGIWQFISSTGRAYGLRHSWWYDERRDPVKSTRAAARHLKDLYERFGDWYLAMAGYNYSPRKIEKRVARYGVKDYWDLPRLPRQTRNYIPKFIAAATIANDPGEYGFSIQREPSVEFDTVTVRECVDLNVVAECVGSTFAEIKKLNPSLLRWCTPPDREQWVLKIPKGTRQRFIKNYSQVPDDKKVSYVQHRIRYGETLSTIARKYRVSMREIKRFNKIRGTLIWAGSYLIIPVPQNKQYYRLYARRATRNRSSYRGKPVKNVPGREKHVYRVKKGDTLWDIAWKFGVTVTQLRKWNGLGRTRIIHPEQELNIWLPEKTNLSQSVLAQLPDPEPAVSGPAPGSNGSQQKEVIYIVRRGDTLWDIASRYGVSIRDIKKWNRKRSSLIHPGEKLKILVK